MSKWTEQHLFSREVRLYIPSRTWWYTREIGGQQVDIFPVYLFTNWPNFTKLSAAESHFWSLNLMISYLFGEPSNPFSDSLRCLVERPFENICWVYPCGWNHDCCDRKDSQSPVQQISRIRANVIHVRQVGWRQ